ncbi:HD domain-containing protein [Spiroplasma endosymbiont of Othius punctulatus]|uniref:HD domain-containing protein n=1 Tax=Spiroplasma endosymbiont of Othius punctulatus TaxID=3066289 RepID=UPI0030D52549
MLKIIRDNIHKSIMIDEQVYVDLINTKEFQRLRRIKQLGSTEFVFPTATHTRFNHCVGTFFVVNRFVTSEGLKNEITDDEKISLKIAGLLHDIGHGPFSHNFEVVSSQPHESYTIDIIRGNTEINDVLKKHNMDIEAICSIIEGKHKNNVLNTIISSQIDADRFDYMMRDAFNVGVPYSSFDIDYILSNMSVKENRIVFSKKVIHAIEDYFVGRYHMYEQVYRHKTSLGFKYTLMFWVERVRDLVKEGYEFKNKESLEYIKEIIENKVIPVDKFYLLDDYRMTNIISDMISEDDKTLSDLSDRLINRRCHKVSFTLSKAEFEKLKSESNLNNKYYFRVIKYNEVAIYSDLPKNDPKSVCFIENNKLITLSEASRIINSKINRNKSIKELYIYVQHLVE